MKKLFTLLLCSTFFGVTTNAATYYVNIGLATGLNNGTSWPNAYQTFAAGITAATNNAGVDDVYIKGTPPTGTSVWSMSVDNYYGSFAGTESTPADRPMNDNDGNGIIEPWEFKYPTVYLFNYNNTAINGSAAILDGFTITHGTTGTPSTVSGSSAMTTLISPIGQTVQNCVFTGSNLSYTSYTNSNGGCLLKVLGTFQNNLIEKNNVSITYGATDIKITPILDVNCPATGSANPTPAVSINGCIFRNNIVTISNTSGTAVTNLKGIILNITANDPAATVVINNCLVYNNEANYTGGGSNSTAGRASIAGSLNFSTSYTSDKYVNCLFANNKMVNLLSCMHVMANTHVIHKGYNNAFWNNQNNSLAVSVTSSSAQISGCIFDNNYLDAANTGSWGNGIWGANNQTNLSKSNTGANSPLFKNPPLNSGANIIGANQTSGNADYTAINQSDWRITATTSYLYHIGAATATTGISTDKAGYAFIAATPSVGAYEATPLLTTSAVTTIASTSATSGGTISWDGGTTIATTGVCWSTSQNPTTANSKTTNGATSGTFTGNMTGLTAGTTYYVRAYATNTTHTAYGMQTSFTTTSTKPEPSNQATSFATGTITSSGIPLSFTAAATGSQAPDGYLVKMSSSSVSDPVDGTDPADLTALTASVANVKVTTSPISSFTSLTAGTLYHYKIYSYTNFGTDINFNTTSAPSLDVYTSTNPVTGATLTPTSSTTADISWTAASGYNSTNHSTLVFVKASGSAITLGTPTNAPSAYTASTVLTAGSTGTAYQGDASAYCVYNGDGTSVSITGLTGNTTYQVLVYTVVDASNTGSTNSYSSAATASGLTYKKEPVSSPTNFAKGTVSSSAISITWTASAINSQGPDGYLLIGKQGSSISTDPTDGTDQSDVTAFTSNLANVKVTSGTATSASSFTNMIAGTMYYYRIYPYTNSGTHIDYKTSNNADLHIATSPNPVTGINISSVDATNMTVNWTTPIGNSATNHGIYVFVKAASSITDGTPTNAGSTYTANTVFGSGAAYQNDASAYCVYKGDGNNVTISGLTVNTTYYVLIYSVYDNTTTNNSDLTNSYSLSSTTSVTTGNPIINGAATASAFTTTYGTASSAQTFSVSGSYLSTSIAANAPTGFEVSSDGTNYASLATIVRSGSVANGTLYIRLKADALVSGAYNAKDIALSSTTTTVNIVTSASGNVVTAKSLTITGTTTANKVYDGTTTATLTGGSLVGVISPDVLTLTQLGTYSDKNVGISKAITANCSISGVSASNYTLTQPTLTARDITVKAVTVTGVTAIKTYNGTTLSTGSPTVGTLASGDIVNVAPTQTYDNKNYGTSHVLTPFGLTIKDGSNADMTANYSITYTPSPSTGEIDKAAVTVTAVTATKTYDGTTSSAGSPTVGALVSGDVVNVAAIQTYDNKNYGTTHVLTPSGLTFKDGSNADMSGNYSITYTPSPATGVINKLALTVTGATTADKEYDGSTTASVTGGSLLGVVSPDAVTLTEAGDFDTKNVGTSKTITANCSIDGAGVGNYTLTQPTLTAKNITAKALTIGAASIASKVYDGSATSGTLTAGTLSGFVSHETITVSSAVGTYSDATVGTGKTATIVYTLANGTNGGLATNYSLANGSATGNITAATSIVDVTSSQNSSDVISGTTSEVTVKGSAVLTVNEASEVKSLATSTGTKVIVNEPLVVNTGGVTLAPNSILELANTATVTGNVEVGTGSKLNFTTANTLSVTGDLILKADNNGTFSANLGSGGITVMGSGKVKYQRTIDDTKWYFMSFPCDVNVAEITGGGTIDVDWFIQQYNGQNRATNGAGSNWEHVTSGVLTANRGYIFGSAAGDKTLTFLLTKAIVAGETTKSINVTNYTGATASTNYGWNLIGQTYLSKYDANSISNLTNMYVFNGLTYTDSHNDTYVHNLPILDPFAAYFTKVTATESLTFGLGSRQSAPSIVTTSMADVLFLDLKTTTGTDRTNIIMDDTQSASYQNGVDYEKMITTGTIIPQVYTVLGGLNYSYNVLPTVSVTNLPLGIYTQTAGITTISVDATQATSLSKLLLTDNGVSPAIVTDLLTSNYSFTAAAGTNTTRFQITAQRITTDNNHIDNSLDAPKLSIHNCQLSIESLSPNSTVRVFDALGRMMVSKTANSNVMEIKLNARGIYIVQLQNGTNISTRKVIF